MTRMAKGAKIKQGQLFLCIQYMYMTIILVSVDYLQPVCAKFNPVHSKTFHEIYVKHLTLKHKVYFDLIEESISWQ